LEDKEARKSDDSMHQSYPYMQSDYNMMQNMHMCPCMMYQQHMQQPMSCPYMMGSMYQPMSYYPTDRDDEESDEDYRQMSGGFPGGYYGGSYGRPQFPHHHHRPYYPFMPFHPYYPYYPYYHQVPKLY
jgi:hypothetical protein